MYTHLYVCCFSAFLCSHLKDNMFRLNRQETQYTTKFNEDLNNKYVHLISYQKYYPRYAIYVKQKCSQVNRTI